jgi:hypothetical protein
MMCRNPKSVTDTLLAGLSQKRGLRNSPGGASTITFTIHFIRLAFATSKLCMLPSPRFVSGVEPPCPP